MTAQPLYAQWSGDAVRLDRALAELQLVRSRSQASELIAAGAVELDGALIRKAGTKVSAGSKLTVFGADHYVSRAAHKLIAGLDAFSVSPESKLCVDVGASTGGFTQVLCERGAMRVLALDVGHDQMAPMVRAENRVQVFEGCNAREMTREMLGLSDDAATLPQLIVADLSFISLRLVLDAMVRVAAPNADFVLLVKPQFEVGRLGVKAGIVTDPLLAAAAVRDVCVCAASLGIYPQGIIASPMVGSFGNQEFVIHFSQEKDLDIEVWDQRITELTNATIGMVNAANLVTAGSDK